MAEFRGIKASLFLVLVLQLTAAATGGRLVRDGGEAVLPCGNVINGHDCNKTMWSFKYSKSTNAIDLVSDGRVEKAKSDRLRVTEDCSLVVKNVTNNDVGRYECKLLTSTPNHVVDLSVVHMTEHHRDDIVTLGCSMRTFERCKHPVKWLFQGQDLGEGHQAIKTSEKSKCDVSVTFQTSHFSFPSRFNLFKCEVTDNNNNKQQFLFSPQTSGENATTAAKEAAKEATKEATKEVTKEATNQVTTATEDVTEADATTPKTGWWVYILVALVLVSLIIIIVAVIKKKRTKGNETTMNDDVADPEDGVSYASVSFTKNTGSEAQVRNKDGDDKSEAVTYATVKASSADPSDPYSTVP